MSEVITNIQRKYIYKYVCSFVSGTEVKSIKVEILERNEYAAVNWTICVKIINNEKSHWHYCCYCFCGSRCFYGYLWNWRFSLEFYSNFIAMWACRLRKWTMCFFLIIFLVSFSNMKQHVLVFYITKVEHRAVEIKKKIHTFWVGSKNGRNKQIKENCK